MSRATAMRLAPWGIAALAGVIWFTIYQHGPWSGIELSDIPYFREVSHRIGDGNLPYFDYDLEYPPFGALVIGLAALVPGSYYTGFSILMMLAMAGLVLGVHATGRAAGLSERRALLAAGVVAVSPLLVGNLLRSRFDVLVATAIVWTLWAAIRNRFVLAWLLLAVAILLKISPVVLIPLLAVYQARRQGRDPALKGLGICVAAMAVVLLPLFALAPSGTWSFVHYNLARPLHIESGGGSLMLVLHQLTGLDVTIVDSYQSRNISGSFASALAAGGALLLIAGTVAIAVFLWRSTRGLGEGEMAQVFLGACAAALALWLVCGKVFGPQFTVLLLPACFILAGRRGIVVGALTVCALLLTQLYYPRHYGQLQELEAAPAAVLFLRNLAILAIVAVAWPRRPRTAEEPAAPAGAGAARESILVPGGSA